ncbi:hypothetical protein JCM33374_g5407 [Metschnikowia sp. JCM 33374]|nr:hypothetical protein JCM33374_g5407 [Metschnikowia sp. JCM 33374]
MDFVAFETFSENDALPSPQPTLSLPLKSNIENLSAKFTNFKEFKNLLKNNLTEGRVEDNSESELADKYAKLSLQLLEDSSKESPNLQNDGIISEKSRSDALSIRLSRALNPNIGDTRMRELFTILESKIIDNPQLIDSGIDGSLARKKLRGEVETDLIKINSSHLSDYARPIRNLKYLGDRLHALEALVSETNSLLIGDSLATSDLRREKAQFMVEKTSINLKKALLVTFRQKFTLNEYEQFLLNSNEINADFFEALKRAEGINESCSVLLALDNPELGNKIMSKTSALINKANEKIITFCSKSLSNTHSFNNKERLSVLHLCLHQLKQKPDQLLVIINAFVQSRSSALLEDFNLQVSGHESMDLSNIDDSRPVYFSSHDPVRFTTDLLAYVHSSAANESEMISGLLKSEEYSSSTSDDVVNKIMVSLTNPIKAKIEEVITVEPKLSILYQIFNVLELYLVMFNKNMHARILSHSIEEGMELIRQKFKILLSSRLSAIQESNSAKLDLSSDLQPPEWIIEYYSDLLPIIDKMHTSTILGMSREGHEKFLELITDRPIEIFYEHLKSVSDSFNKREKMLFKLNFLDLIVSKIIPLSLLGDKMLEINHTINDLSHHLEEIQFQTLLSDCLLTDHYNVMNMICPVDEEFAEASLYSAVTESRLFQRDNILSLDEKIQSVIPSALLDIQSNLMKLNNPLIVNEIITSSSLRFLRFYKLLREVAQNYVDECSFTWSDYEVATLLGASQNDLIHN